jgi:formamidopyrimidine-DNA glycosylase
VPELPEVETIRCNMEVNIGARVERLQLFRQDIIRQQDYSPEELEGKTLLEIGRRGKFLILSFSQSYKLIVHLGMSGRFYLLPAEQEITEKHVHLIITLNNGNSLAFQDARRFGGVWFCFNPREILKNLGIEPLGDDFDVDYLGSVCANRKVVIKTLLLNQNFIAGLGNIYADEALFRAGIRPDRPSGTLTEEELEKLQRAIIEVLESSIKQRGTTFRDYRDGMKRAGNFQNFLKVYGREGKACPVCSHPINKTVLGGRSSHFCARCQK